MNADIHVRAVQSRTDMRRFIELPYELYEGSQCWVPPLRLEQKHCLNTSSNPFCEHGHIQPFLALDSSGTVLGRIAAVLNEAHLEKYKDGRGFFGFFECVERYDVAEALLDAAAGWLRDRGLSNMRGPASPSLNDVAGLLVKGFERRPTFFMPYNPPFYEDFLHRYGCERAMTLFAYYLHRRYADLERAREWIELMREHYPSVALRPTTRRRYAEDAALLLEIYNEGMSDTWGHVPFCEREFNHLSRILRRLVDPEFLLFLELDGEPIGFSLLLPDFNEVLRHMPKGRLLPLGWFHGLLRWRLGHIHTLRAAMGGVRAAYRGQGFAAVMGLLTLERHWASRYDGVEFSWILQTNRLSIDALERVGAVRDKEYALFDRAL